MAVDIDTLQIEIEANANEAVSGIDKLAATLERLKNAVSKGGVSGLNATAGQMSKLASAAKELSKVSLGEWKVGEIAKAINSLSAIQKPAGLTSAINALGKIPKITEQLKPQVLDEFAVAMERTANAVRPLATEMQKVSNGFAAFPIRIQKIIASNAGLAASNQKAAKSFNLFGPGIAGAISKLTVFGFGLKQLFNIGRGWINESASYVENLNLFTVAMGEGADEALRYAEEVQKALGIDMSEFIRNQGVFKQITSGFGVMAEKANLMSKNLTQLGYDISSFFNIRIEDAMLKLQSGISGELEPLRRLGYALDVATLQQIAYEHGISQSINTMTQAQKSQLRYLAIMEQSTNAMGDMASTLITPSNAMRILQQQVTQLSRALGNLLIPFLIKVIPYVQAFVEVITEAIQALAVLVGFELPTIDHSDFGGLVSGAQDGEDAINGAAGAAKELKRALLGIDELNIIEPTSAAGGSGVGGIGGGDLGIELPEYDFLKNIREQTDELKEKMRTILDDYVIPISVGLAGWALTSKFVKSIAGLKNTLKNFPGLKKAIGITLMVAGFSLEASGAFDLGYNGFNLKDAIRTAIGAALGIAGSLLVFGTGPIGWTIGIATALTVGIASFVMGYNRRQIDEEIKSRFGEIELTLQEASELAEKIMSGPLAIQLDLYVEAKTSAETAINNYLKSSEKLTYLTWKVSLGLDVDQNELMSSIDSVVSDAQTFLSAQKESFMLAINIGFSDVGIQTEMAQFVNTYFSQSEAEMTRLGEELKQTMLDALADGIIDEQEMLTIANLQSEMQQMLAAVADAEYKAKLTNTIYELDGELSFDSVKMVRDELEILAQEKLNTLEDAHLQVLTAIELKYQSDGNYDEYTAAIQDNMETYFFNQAEVSRSAFQPLVDKFNTAFSDALGSSQSAFDTPMENLITSTFQIFEKDETGRLVDGSIVNFMTSVKDRWGYEFNNLDVTPEARATLEETLSALEPSAQQLQKIADDARAAGYEVPKGISDGLSNYYMLAAITGDLDAINYLMGEKFSTDPSFIEALQTAKDAGKEINGKIAEGLTDHIQVINNADGTISIINDTIGNKVLEITPELVENLKGLGIDISGGLLEGTESEIKSRAGELGDIGKFVGEGIAKGLKKANIDAEISGFTNNFVNKTRKYSGINSPSKLFRDEVGIYLGLGIAEGLSDSMKPILGEANSILNSVSGVFSGVAFNIPTSLAMKDINLPGRVNVDPARLNVHSMIPAVSSYATGREVVNENAQGGLSDGVADGQTETINAIYAMGSMIVRALEQQEGNVYLDQERVGRALRGTMKRLDRESGTSLVRKGF